MSGRPTLKLVSEKILERLRTLLGRDEAREPADNSGGREAAASGSWSGRLAHCQGAWGGRNFSEEQKQLAG